MKFYRIFRNLTYLLLIILLLTQLSSCVNNKIKNGKLTVNIKNSGWISENLYIINAFGISEPKLVTEEAVISAKKSAIINAQQNILEIFRKISFNSKLKKTVKGKSIVEIIKMGKIISYKCKDNSCNIKYSVEFKGLKDLIKKSDLNDYILIN